jgi:hypothetical protein
LAGAAASTACSRRHGPAAQSLPSPSASTSWPRTAPACGSWSPGRTDGGGGLRRQWPPVIAWIVRLGWIGDQAKADLLAGASVFAYVAPGVRLLPRGDVGQPVVATGAALPEACGDGRPVARRRTGTRLRWPSWDDDHRRSSRPSPLPTLVGPLRRAFGLYAAVVAAAE